MNEFMGHPVEYWLALEKQVDELNVEHLIGELGKAYAKIGFYERRIKEMATMGEKQ